MKKTRLQSLLKEEHLDRGYPLMRKWMATAGISLDLEIMNRLMQQGRNDLVIVDGGCGTGRAIQEVLTLAKSQASNVGVDCNVKAVGVDLNPIVDSDSSDVEFKAADLVALPFANDSVDIFYSWEALIYVSDVLKAFEEVYRALNVGGVGILKIDKDVISLWPGFDEILDSTEGGRDVFQYVEGGQNFVVCRKSENDKFVGFPYEGVKKRQIPKEFAERMPALEFVQKMVYRKVNGTLGDFV